MSWLKKIKNLLGIGGVKVVLEVSEEIAADADGLHGVVLLTTKSEQEILSIDVKLEQVLKTGRGEDADEKTKVLTSAAISVGRMIQPGETHKVNFFLPFDTIKTKNEQLQEMGGVLGSLGTLKKFKSNESSSFVVTAAVDVKDVFLDPLDMQDIKLI